MKRFLSLFVLSFVLTACGGGGASVGSPAVPPTNPPVSGVPLPSIPDVVAQHGVATVELRAVTNPTTGMPEFEYQGRPGVAPTIRVRPGGKIVVDLTDDLGGSGMGSDLNLHFHGLTVSPMAPADDVLTMLAMPGHVLHYVVPIPATQEPGLYWYHPHVHGETDYQVGLAGMSGAIVIEGLQKHIPALAAMKERILIVRDVADSVASALAIRHNDGAPKGGMKHRASTMRPMDVDQNNNPCGPDPGVQLTLDGVVRPTIAIRPGESQFFRLVNATGHRNLKLSVDGATMQIVAIDGVALDAYPGTPATMTVSQYVVPPASRVEFVVVGSASGASALRTLCYNSGPAGDPDGPEVLADLRAPSKDGNARAVAIAPKTREALRVGAPLPHNVLSQAISAVAAQRIVRFTEDSNGFYINGQAFDPNSAPMFTVRVGTVEKWTVLNLTEEVHDFHTHQVHFYVQSVNGNRVAHPHWADSVVLPARKPGINGTFTPGAIETLVDFRNPVIRGTFVFHCHILDHEDGGMMAKMAAI